MGTTREGQNLTKLTETASMLLFFMRVNIKQTLCGKTTCCSPAKVAGKGGQLTAWNCATYSIIGLCFFDTDEQLILIIKTDHLLIQSDHHDFLSIEIVQFVQVVWGEALYSYQVSFLVAQKELPRYIQQYRCFTYTLVFFSSHDIDYECVFFFLIFLCFLINISSMKFFKPFFFFFKRKEKKNFLTETYIGVIQRRQR